MSKFERKSKLKTVQISGTKLSLKNSILLASTGIPSLDAILGGGLPVGSLLLIEEDAFGTYSEVILKYFIAAGVSSENFTHHCSLDSASHTFMSNIPGECDSEQIQMKEPGSQEKMKIAWRYANMKPSDLEHSHMYDFSKRADTQNYCRNRQSAWEPVADDLFSDLLNNINNRVGELNLFAGAGNVQSNLLRITVQSLGSPLWGLKYDTDYSKISSFLTKLRFIVRNSFSIAVVTVPKKLTEDVNFLNQIRYASDISLGLESFAGSDKEAYSSFMGFDGIFNLHKLAPINSLTPLAPITKDWVFKIHKHKFSIDKFHLPPFLTETASRTSSSTVKPKSAPCGIDF